MTHTFAKRNHYNPCFWTACWNPEYYKSLVSGGEIAGSPRDQEVFALNLRSMEIYRVSVDKVFFDKNLGVAEITPDAMRDFRKRRFPSEYETFTKYLDTHPETLYMDFEDVLSGVEQVGGYDSLMDAVKKGGILSVMHKGFLTCLLVIQAMRSHEMMNSMLDTMSDLGMSKWEYFWVLKNAWGNKLVLARAGMALAFSRWTLYRTNDHTFPLCDSPVMIRRNTLMATLSPRLLLEISLNERAPEEQWKVRDGIRLSKFRQFRRRAIGNAFKDIVFHNRAELERWRDTDEFRERSRALNDKEESARLTHEAASRVIWGINGFGRIPPDFEYWMRKFELCGIPLRDISSS